MNLSGTLCKTPTQYEFYDGVSIYLKDLKLADILFVEVNDYQRSERTFRNKEFENFQSFYAG